MPVFPTPFTVDHYAYEAGGVDAHGNPVEGFADPVVVPVYGWATPGSDSEVERNRSAVERDLDVYSPTGGIGPQDRVEVDGSLFEVVGYAEDYNHGPFGFTPGYRWNLKRAEDH